MACSVNALASHFERSEALLAMKQENPEALCHFPSAPAALRCSETSMWLSLYSFARRQRSDKGTSWFSITTLCADSHSELSLLTIVCAISRVYSYSFICASGERLPGVSRPWPLSIKIVMQGAC